MTKANDFRFKTMGGDDAYVKQIRSKSIKKIVEECVMEVTSLKGNSTLT